MAEEKLANDILRGCPAIADYIGESPRQTYHLLETGQLPGFKMPNGREWRARKSTLNRHYEHLDNNGQRLDTAVQRVAESCGADIRDHSIKMQRELNRQRGRRG
jgi:hypothetical protein